jgi:ribosomal protein S18 acetylase RimI-like enzyme
VRRAQASDVGALSATLAAAFFNDPVFAWCYPSGERRRRILVPWFDAVLTSNLVHGDTYTTDNAVAGAVWTPPGAEEDDKLGDRLAEISGPDAERLLAAFALMEANHPHQPHHYLFLLATRPEMQSHGIGSRLLRPVLEQCDRDATPAYLEATSENSRRLYLRHGFEPVGEIRLPGGPSMWPMWREPSERSAPR